MKLLGLDFETSGCDPARDRIIEIGAVLWDTDRGVPLEIMGKLVRHPGLEISEEITRITGITNGDLADNGVSLSEALAGLRNLFDRAEHIVAHNGNAFDKPFLEEALRSTHLMDLLWNKPWIDTMTDVPYPDDIRTRKLNHLAADHQVFNPLPHRAVFDVIVMLQILSKYPLDGVLELAASPSIEIQAEVSFDDRNLAKARGFRWDAERRIWCKTIKEIRIPRETHSEFRIRVLQCRTSS